MAGEPALSQSLRWRAEPAGKARPRSVTLQEPVMSVTRETSSSKMDAGPPVHS